MKRFICLIASLWCFVCGAQDNGDWWRIASEGVAAASSSVLFNPTNTAIGANFWWEPSVGAYITNSGTAHLPNLSSAGAVFDFTNGVTANLPLQGPTLNGLRTVFFKAANGCYLNAMALTNTTYPMEMVFYITLTNNNGTFQQIMSSKSGNMASAFSTPNLQLNTGNGETSLTSFTDTNHWMILDLIWNGNSSTAFTNQVQSATLSGQSTANAFDGLTLMNGAGIFNGSGSIASICCITQATFGASAWSSARSNLFFYYTNRFGEVPQ